MRTLNSLTDSFLRLNCFTAIRSIFGLFGLVYFHTSSVGYIFSIDKLFQIPLFDLFPLNSQIFVVGCILIHFVSLVLFIFNFKVEYTGLLAGLSKLVILLTRLDGVLAFAYFMPIGWIAFSLVEALKQKNSRLSAFPLILFLSSVFISATFHKLVNLEGAHLKLPLEMNHYLRGEFNNYTDMIAIVVKNPMFQFVTLSEFLVGILLLFKRTRMLSIYLIFLFSVTAFTLLELKYVGVMLLTISLAIVSFQKNVVLRDLSRLPKCWGLLFIVGLGASFSMKATSNSLLILTGELLFSAVTFGPFLLLAVFFKNYTSSLEPKPQKLSHRDLSLTGLFALFLFCFSLSPLVDHYRKTNMLGWSMFSGANAEKPLIKVQMKLNNCPIPPHLFPVLSVTAGSDAIELSSFSEELLKRYVARYKALCPAAEVSRVFKFPSVIERNHPDFKPAF